MELVSYYDMASYDAVIEKIYQVSSQKNADFSEKMRRMSEYFLGKPYLTGALGEGLTGEFDQNPLYRTDYFDCVTFLNTVLALALGRNLEEFQRWMLTINYYNKTPRYENRFHFMNIDWNQQNEQLGVVADITQEVCENTLVSQTGIDRSGWFRFRNKADIKLLQQLSEEAESERLNQLHALAKKVGPAESALAYIPLNLLIVKNKVNFSIVEKIPNGAIVEIVRPQWDLRNQIGTYLDISHVGIVFWIEGALVFRHASTTEKKVVDIPLLDYLRKYCLNKESIKGIHLLVPISQQKY